MGCYLHFRLEGKLRWSPEPQQGRGRIINISSQAGFVALPTESIYCMMKAGIAQLTKCLAVEWGPDKSNVNAVAPTFIHTPGMEPALSSADFYAETLRNVAALHRIGEPPEICRCCRLLASQAASLGYRPCSAD